MATKKKVEKKKGGTTSGKNNKLKAEHELYCILYTGHHNRDLFGNASRCYLEAFGLNIEIEKIRGQIDELARIKDRGYTTEIKKLESRIKVIENSARTCSSRLSTNVNIRARIDQIMDTMISDEFNDREMQYVISQRYDLASKVAAMREYNALKQRIKKNPEEATPSVVIHIAPEMAGKFGLA